MEIQGIGAIVTGGASGLGEATARALAARGAQVAILDLGRSKGAEVAASLGGGAFFADADVTDEAAVTSALSDAASRFGGLHVCVNCAGIGSAMRTVDREGRPFDLRVFKKTVEINLIGSFNVLRLAASHMVKNAPNADGERGVIVNTASAAAFDGQIGQAAYSASKAGVVGMTLPIARDLSKLGIRICTIAPGLFETPLLMTMPEPARQALAATIPFPPRLGRPPEFASLALQIVENAMLNGETIRLDGAVRMPPSSTAVELGRLAVSLPAPFVPARACIELGRRAEAEWGYPAIWLAETQGPDSFSLAGALAMVTERVTIGTAIVPVYNRSPAVLAMSAGTLAELSGDRFVLGLGSSSHAIIEGWNGIPFERPLAHVREAVQIVRQALVDGKTDFQGEVFRSKGLRVGARTRRPVPVYVAALREKMLRLAGALGDGLIVNLFPVSALPRILGAWRSGASEAGQDVSGQEVVCRFQVCVTDDVARARQLVRAGFGGYVATPVYNRFFAWCGFEDVAKAVADAFARGDRAGVAAAMTDDFVDRIAIIGSAEACREQVASFVAAGVTTPVIAPLALDRAGVERVLEAFAPARPGG